MKRIHCIVQARLGSTRLPGKIFLIGKKKPLIDHLIERLKFSKQISKIIIATPETYGQDLFKIHFNLIKDNIFFGPENNVLARYYKCAKKFNSKIIVRITSDCPLMDYRIIDKMILYFKKKKCDYLSNVHPRNYPSGLDVEIFKFSALKRAYFNAKKNFEKEHVTPYIWRNPKKFKILNYKSVNLQKNLNKNYRLTLDYLEDYILIATIFKKLYKNDKKFSFDKILKFLKKNHKISKINKKFIN